MSSTTSTVTWQRVRLPPVERIVLSDLAARRGLSDEELLATLIHDEAAREILVAGKDDQEVHRG